MSDVLLSMTLLLLLLGAGSIALWLRLRARRRRRIVEETSTALASLRQLNAESAARLIYPPPINYEWIDWASSKAAMDRYNLTNLLWTNLLAYEGHFEAQLQGHLKAAAAYADYYAAYEALWREHLGKSGSPDVKPSAYQGLELKLFRMGQLPAFRCSAHIRCVVRYTSPKGQNSYWCYQDWDFEGLYREFHQMRQVRDKQSTTQFLRQQERQRVTARVRFDVFTRDGHRCVVCGSTAEVEPLHVDHIVPVSRGGTSDLDNLQTLCQTCNLGKSNRH